MLCCLRCNCDMSNYTGFVHFTRHFKTIQSVPKKLEDFERVYISIENAGILTNLIIPNVC
jgi:hypothetical protein